MTLGRAWALVILLLVALALALATPMPAAAQVFLANHANPQFTIGPLFVRGLVTPQKGPLPVDIFWGLVVPPDVTLGDVDGDLFVLWPGRVTGDASLGKPDPALAKYIHERGLEVTQQGRLQVFSVNLYRAQGAPAREPVPGGAPFVTFARNAGPLGHTTPATYIRIPWTPKLLNRAVLMDLHLSLDGAITPRKANWVETLFWGPRDAVSITFNDVNHRALFALYLENRDRVIRLAEEPAQLLLDFSNSEHLKIDQIYPPTSRRQPSETQRNTERVSRYIDRAEGLVPQALSVDYVYLSGVQSWAPILIPFLFFLAGNLAGPLVRAVFHRVSRTLSARFAVSGSDEEAPTRQHGVILSRQTLERIVTGETTYDDVIRMCGPHAEIREQLGAPERRTLIYTGRRVVPRHRRRVFGRLTAVSGWDAERHEVEIDFERNVVRDVHVRVRRTAVAHPETVPPA